MDKDEQQDIATDQLQSVEFHYIKVPSFHSVHVDGAIGSLTTKGFLHMALYVERNAIPRKTGNYVLPNGVLGDEKAESLEIKEGIIRQMEIGLIINEETTRDLRNWLDDRLKDFEDRRKKLKEIKGD